MRWPAPSAPASPAIAHWLWASARPLMSFGIHAPGKRLDADAAHCLQEFLALFAPLHIHIENARDRLCHFFLADGRTDDLAQRTRAADRAAQRDLVPLDAMLVDAKDA